MLQLGGLETRVFKLGGLENTRFQDRWFGKTSFQCCRISFSKPADQVLDLANKLSALIAIAHMNWLKRHICKHIASVRKIVTSKPRTHGN